MQAMTLLIALQEALRPSTCLYLTSKDYIKEKNKKKLKKFRKIQKKFKTFQGLLLTGHE